MATQPKDWQAEWIKLQAESRKLAKRANQRLVRLERAAKKPGMENILKYAYKSAVADIKTLGKVSGKPRFKETVKLVDAYDKDGNVLSGQAMYKQNVSMQKMKIKMMKEFLDAASSTIGQGIAGIKEGLSRTIGIKRIWNKTTKTINKKYLKDYDLRMSDDDMKRFFDSKKQAKLEKEVGSGRMFIVASYIKKNNLKTNKRDLEKFLKEHIDLSKYSDLDPEDIKGRKGENYKQYLDRLDSYINFTGDEILDDYIKKALKKGINVDNLFAG
jgi:hypothetical protein